MQVNRSEGQESAPALSPLDSLCLKLNAAAFRLALQFGRCPAAVQVMLVYLASRIVKIGRAHV